MSPGEAAHAIAIEVNGQRDEVMQKVKAKYPDAARELKNAAHTTLSGPSPSAPGSTPGVRSGHLRRDWSTFYGDGSFGITSQAEYSGHLEHGTSKMAARPYVEKVKEQAMPKIRSIFSDL